jgi:hypothetical protein
MKEKPSNIPPKRVAGVLTRNVPGLTNSDQNNWIGTGTSKPKERQMGPGTFPKEENNIKFGKKRNR